MKALIAFVVVIGLSPSLFAFASKPDPKAWQTEAVWYQIFPERFRNGDPSNDPIRDSLGGKEWAPESWRVRAWTSDWYARDAWEQARGDNFFWTVSERRYGGDIQGIIDKLDYLRDLGINAIYLNPVFWSGSHHKYDTYSFHHVDPYFGPDPKGDLALIASETEDPATWKWTAADKLFLEMVAKAHERGMRVIIDGVFNHAGLGFSPSRTCATTAKTRASRTGSSCRSGTIRKHRRMTSSGRVGTGSSKCRSLQRYGPTAAAILFPA
jgi:hypothetical protein